MAEGFIKTIKYEEILTFEYCGIEEARDKVLMDHGVSVLRFPSGLLFQDPAAILDRIRLHLTELYSSK